MSISVAAAGAAGATSAGSGGEARTGGIGQWLIVAGIVTLAGVLSGFYAVNEYAAGTGQLVARSTADAERFESIYRDSAEKRLATLRFGLEILRQNDGIIGPFVRGDRAALQARVEPLFKTVLQKRYGLDQLNFFVPPATVYFRADDPKVMGNDLSAVRRTVVVAGERRQMVSGMETGLGGVVALRAVMPVLDGERLVGTIGVGDAIEQHLGHAAETAGMEWGLGLNRAVAEKAERPVDPKTDANQGDDVFFSFSSAETGRVVRGARFDARSAAPSLLSFEDRTVFVKSFPLNNFAGVPTVAIAALRDLTDGFAEVRRSVLVKAAVLFLVIAVGGSVALVKFRAIRGVLHGAMGRQRRELEAKSAALAAAKAKLEVADTIKRGFFTNMVLSLNEPLQAVVGQLQTVTPAVDSVLAGANGPDEAGRGLIADQLRFALNETSRFSGLIADYRGLEDLRRDLARVETRPVILAALVAVTVDQDLAPARRLPHLSIRSTLDETLPTVLADASSLRRALAGLIDYAVKGAGRGSVVIAGTAAEDGKTVTVSVTGTAFQIAGAPTADLLNEAHQFLWRLSASPAEFEGSGSVIGILEAQAIVRSFGGRLEAADAKAGQPGFLLRLATAS